LRRRWGGSAGPSVAGSCTNIYRCCQPSQKQTIEPSFTHYHRTEFSWRPKTAKEYRKTAKEMFFGSAPPSMNRQVWIARKIEFPWRLALKQCFLDCQPAKKNMDM